MLDFRAVRVECRDASRGIEVHRTDREQAPLWDAKVAEGRLLAERRRRSEVCAVEL